MDAFQQLLRGSGGAQAAASSSVDDALVDVRLYLHLDFRLSS